MIYLTRINRTSLVLNSDLIESIQSTPDTVITLTNSRNYMVLESPEEIIGRVVAFRRKIVMEPVSQLLRMPVSVEDTPSETSDAR